MNTIDELLKDWSACNKASAAEKSRIVSRIQKRLGDEVASPSNSCRCSFSRFVLFVPLAAAALVLFGLFFSVWLNDPVASRNNLLASLSIDSDEVVDKWRLFQQVNRLFDSRLEWLAEVGHQVEIGLDESARGATAPQSDPPPILLKVALLRTHDASKEGRRVIWQNDLVVRGERMVSFSPTFRGASQDKLTVWLYPVNDTQVLVDFELDVISPASLFVSSTNNVIVERDPRCVFKTRTNTGEIYEMHMVASRLCRMDCARRNVAL
jgi:hypothetical protein